ncbi:MULTISPECIES: aspartoacylase [unclassified Anabaena]|uniref:aspartoacylase n=1 Tax=unclassified Anabaena TaxID=2619674 RepID=UPI0014478ABC|nr:MULTISPECIES: aspartoacylase [unclassified Anabaena]MTJ06734.1 aspartoacylase [Anabaena sp. UHCC 0204]MTJ55025.1 aspartoacylase [Anabaena sp. UHCC 0253]
MNKINSLAIVGGNHGNELTGIYLVKKFQQYPNLIYRQSFETLSLLGNPQAIIARTRYIEKDLNRCFIESESLDTKTSSYEELRAKEIQAILHPPNQKIVDVIIDLHTTTANMGLCIILGSDHPVLLGLAADLSAINPLVKVYLHPQPKGSGFLRSLSELGFALEVGAVPQGILNAELFQQTEQLIYAILDYFEAYNQGKNLPKNQIMTVYQSMGIIDYPRNTEGEIQAMVHPELQFRDYEPLHPGDPMFLTFAGKEILYQGNSTVYPIFINEAAYYEKGIAMHISKKELIQIS